MEHHSNIVPSQLLPERTGAKLVYLPVTGDEELLDLDRLDQMLTSQVKLFTMVHFSNTLGTVKPVVELGARDRQLRVTTLVDAAQRVGPMPLDVHQINRDFLVLSGPNLCDPTGIGARYGQSELLNAMPPYQGGNDIILSVDFHQTSDKEAPHNFEAGTPGISGPVAMCPAMD